MAFFDPTLVSLVAILGVMALTLGATVAWGFYQVQSGRLPEATRFTDIRERLALAQVELVRMQAELRESDRKIHERDRLIAEVQVHEQRLGELRLELENLVAAREEIRRVKDEAAEAASSKATVERELKDLMDQVQRVRAELDPDRISELERRKREAEEEMRRLQAELELKRQASESALRIIGEAKTIETRVEALRLEIERLEAEITDLRSNRDRLAADLAEARALREAERRAYEEARAGLGLVEAECRQLRDERGNLANEIKTLKTLRDSLKAMVQTVGRSSPELGQPSDDQRKAMLADLVKGPVCLKRPETLRTGQPRSEIDALDEVKKYLSKHRLVFSERTVNAFHTALKINDTSQLTVLAGVSGTGKSLLPRRYAEAMGIHFLQVAVEPRWDSPQDLLGFYNYVEQKYRATELARLLAYLDPWRSLDLPKDAPDYRNHMALVLLDEMNLARVEYYFSEFLSRLEARPAWRTGLSQDACKDALIPVDIRGLDDTPRLLPAHNLLFVGTMNDDESTQSLSDKVLDRGNVLQFAAPRTFETPKGGGPASSSDAQSFTEWRGWVRSVEELPTKELEIARKTIDTLSSIMRGFSRSFGHRLNQAILAYAANYPRKPHDRDDQLDVRLPLADQIEFRILPKLRGLDVDQHQREFDDLDRLIRTELDDAEFAEKVRDEQNHSSRLFVWRGLTRRT
jgi:hypothetical protein